MKKDVKECDASKDKEIDEEETAEDDGKRRMSKNVMRLRIKKLKRKTKFLKLTR